ncbi:MAG: TolC family outer membrane protein [Alphaproteobacteria bacterium]
MVTRFAAVLLIGLLIVGKPSPGFAETLIRALTSAYSNNPQVNAARAATRAADENVPLARSSLRPIITGSTGITAATSNSRTAGLGMNRDSIDGSVGITVTQDIFRGFRTKNAILGANAGVEASREALRNTIQNVLFDGAESYMNVLRDEALLGLGRRNVGFLNEQLRAARDRFEVGENTRTDVAQTEARLSAATADVSLAQANLQASHAVYRQVIGHEAKRLTPGFSFRNLLPKSFRSALKVAQSEHPAVLSAIHSADVAAYEVKQIEGELLPTVSLEASASHIFGIDNSNYSSDASIGGRVSIPIYQGGAVSARVRQSKETLAQRQIEVDVSRDRVRAATVASWGALEAARAAITSATAQVEASSIALNGVQEEQKVGQRTTLDVLDAQQELLDARVSLVLTQRASVVASFAVMSAIGWLNENKLNLPVERYNPRDHFDAVRDKWYGTLTPDGR